MILTYHQLATVDCTDPYVVTKSRLESQLKLLMELNRGDRSNKTHSITFDDGHVSNYLYGIPLLDKYSFHAIFFVIGSRIQGGKDVMSWSQIQELLSSGHSIQSHSWSHQVLIDCSEATLRNELVRSKQALEEKTSLPVNAISVPYGRWDRRVLRACAESGYTKVYTSDPWMRAGPLEGVSVSGRLTVRSNMENQELCQLLTASGLSLLKLRAPYLTKRIARRILGDKAYNYIWRRFSPADEPRRQISAEAKSE